MSKTTISDAKNLTTAEKITVFNTALDKIFALELQDVRFENSKTSFVQATREYLGSITQMPTQEADAKLDELAPAVELFETVLKAIKTMVLIKETKEFTLLAENFLLQAISLIQTLDEAQQTQIISMSELLKKIYSIYEGINPCERDNDAILSEVRRIQLINNWLIKLGEIKGLSTNPMFSLDIDKCMQVRHDSLVAECCVDVITQHVCNGFSDVKKKTFKSNLATAICSKKQIPNLNLAIVKALKGDARFELTVLKTEIKHKNIIAEIDRLYDEINDSTVFDIPNYQKQIKALNRIITWYKKLEEASLLTPVFDVRLLDELNNIKSFNGDEFDAFCTTLIMPSVEAKLSTYKPKQEHRILTTLNSFGLFTQQAQLFKRQAQKAALQSTLETRLKQEIATKPVNKILAETMADGAKIVQKTHKQHSFLGRINITHSRLARTLEKASNDFSLKC